ncbi:MAG: hypothetical protein IPK59_05805 [Rhodospirillaceae bacterium]|nr:hypothetical protein [Rhodospirillaceae bacterium]
MPKKNPLNLNALQLKTLTLFQALSGLEGYAVPAEEAGHTLIQRLPHAHDDHFHLGPWVLSASDATGLGNEAAWRALERKGLIQSMFPRACILTPAGHSYDTGMRQSMLHEAHHH